MVLATTLSGNFNAGAAIVAGLVGGAAFLVVVYMGLGVGMTRMNFLPMLGSMVAPSSPTSTQYGIGLMIHAMMSAAFGLVHAGFLTAFNSTTVGAVTGEGLLLGAIHGLIILVAMPMMLTMAHPLVKNGELAQPGFALTGYGSMTPLGSLMAHVAFGVLVGAVYASIVI